LGLAATQDPRALGLGGHDRPKSLGSCCLVKPATLTAMPNPCLSLAPNILPARALV